MIIFREKRFSWFSKEPEIVQRLQELDKDPELNRLRSRSKVWKKHLERGRTWGAPDVWVDPKTYNIYVCWSNGLIQYKGSGEYYCKNSEIKGTILDKLEGFMNSLEDSEKRKKAFKYPPNPKDIPAAVELGRYLIKLIEERL